MERKTVVRVKICCIASVEEAGMAIRAGASALGLVSAMPSGPGVISEEEITEIAAWAPPGIATFLLTSRQDVPSIIRQQQKTGANTLQLVDRLVEGKYEELKEALPGIKIVQVIHVTGEESIEEARQVSEQVDAILLDSGNPNLKVKELGGTGRAHDWRISRKIREAIEPTPLYLAGGLRPENVAEAVQQVQTFGVDVCSGVRTDGKLDEEKLVRFISEVKKTFDCLAMKRKAAERVYEETKSILNPPE